MWPDGPKIGYGTVFSYILKVINFDVGYIGWHKKIKISQPWTLNSSSKDICANLEIMAVTSQSCYCIPV